MDRIGHPSNTSSGDRTVPVAVEPGMPCATLTKGRDAMHGQSLQCKVCIRNPHGFHLRPITAFAVLAQRFQSQVTVTKDDCTVDGKSPFQMMTMISPPGTELVLEASGPDAQEALKALVDLVENVVFQDEPDSPLPPKG